MTPLHDKNPRTPIGPTLALTLLLAACTSSIGGDPVVLLANSNPVQVRNGDEVGPWTLVRQQDPDIFSAVVGPGERTDVCFLSGERSLCRRVTLGDQFDFTIHFEGFDYPTRIVGVPPAANFTADWQAAHRGRIEVEIPEVYELVNIALAITPTARASPFLIARDNAYYAEVDAWFSRFNDHPLIAALDRELAAGQYFLVKMNGYAFVFDPQNRLTRSPIYNRTGFTGSSNNPLDAHLEELQSFADASNFREFFRAHRNVYEEQVRYYRDTVDLSAMLTWLRTQFPGVRAYDGHKVVFSPLVGANQSVTWLENSGYRELQAHVNFPYPSRREEGLSPASIPLRRGRIVFTELNHGFINPAADQYTQDIERALNNRAFWAKAGSGSDNYRGPGSLFLEMMNWALIALYENDNAPQADRERLIADLDRIMGDEGRGFSRFAAFKAELLRLYRARPPGATVESLYPQMIAWCAAHQNTGAPSQPGGAP